MNENAAIMRRGKLMAEEWKEREFEAGRRLVHNGLFIFLVLNGH